MVDKSRFVFDTNVIVSALLLRKSVARRAFDKAAKMGKILLSLEVIEELYEVLQRPASMGISSPQGTEGYCEKSGYSQN
jgi:predicted nucleic acid-binding protein